MKRKLLILLVLVLPACLGFGHPHMFIDSRVTFQFDETGLTGYRVTWWFDGGFTAMILADYDTDRNMEFSASEIRDIEQNAFSNLENYGYFMYISLEGVPIPAETPVNFTAYLDGKRLVYEFFVPLSVPADYDWRTVKLAIYDETFFCDIVFVDDKPVMSRGYYPYEVTSDLAPDSDIVISYDNANTFGGREGKAYSGYANPMTVTLRFRRK
jgi:ABC-type uncharacterized transport system substrate-binding protein